MIPHLGWFESNIDGWNPKSASEAESCHSFSHPISNQPVLFGLQWRRAGASPGPRGPRRRHPPQARHCPLSTAATWWLWFLPRQGPDSRIVPQLHQARQRKCPYKNTLWFNVYEFCFFKMHSLENVNFYALCLWRWLKRVYLKFVDLFFFSLVR